MSEDIKKDIVQKRLERIAAAGFAFGHPVPVSREVPLVAFDRPPFVICEVKRKSPSKGVISGGLDAVGQARSYVEAGVKTISVLTEEDFFSGSLLDLMQVKKAFPDTAVLRKDFLVAREDIDVSWRAGADAVLLIAAILSKEELADLSAYAEELGLAVFLEIHGTDALKAESLKPRFTGINCRDLTDFSIDRALPLMTRPLVTWPTRLVFESGISRPEEAQWAGDAGFQGVLVGEAAVKNPALASGLVKNFRPAAIRHPAPELSFWARLYEKKKANRPLVKICGLAHRTDMEQAEELGADLLGFILASSKRQVDAGFVRTLPKTKALKVGVLQLKKGEAVPGEVVELIEEGFLDALQFHGEEDAFLVDTWANSGYKAVGLMESEGLSALEPFRNLVAPRLLVDAQVRVHGGAPQKGGTGKRVSEETLRSLGVEEPIFKHLWLAGGLGPENIAEVLRTWKPELIDASSGLELSPGVKDPAKLNAYFREIQHVSVS